MKEVIILRRALTIMVAVIIVFSLAGSVLAADKPKSTGGMNFVAGTVKTIDAAAKTIVITAQSSEVAIVWNDNTRVTSESAKKTIADIKAGDIVATVYKEVEGKNVAGSITFKNVSK